MTTEEQLSNDLAEARALNERAEELLGTFLTFHARLGAPMPPWFTNNIQVMRNLTHDLGHAREVAEQSETASNPA